MDLLFSGALNLDPHLRIGIPLLGAELGVEVSLANRLEREPHSSPFMLWQVAALGRPCSGRPAEKRPTCGPKASLIAEARGFFGPRGFPLPH
jgi:hypothetical protein